MRVRAREPLDARLERLRGHVLHVKPPDEDAFVLDLAERAAERLRALPSRNEHRIELRIGGRRLVRDARKPERFEELAERLGLFVRKKRFSALRPFDGGDACGGYLHRTERALLRLLGGLCGLVRRIPAASGDEKREREARERGAYRGDALRHDSAPPLHCGRGARAESAVVL